MTTLQESADRLRQIGYSNQDAERVANERHDTERERIKSIDPKAVSKAEQEVGRAQAALDAAQSGLEQRRAAIASLESAIVSLGKHRELIAEFHREFSFDDEASTAANVFSAWEASVKSHCPQTVTAYRAALHSAAIASAIRPHVAAKLEALKTVEAQLLDAIIEQAKTEKIDLENLLHVMRGESGVKPKTRTLGNEHLHGLFARGMLDGIAKT